MTKPILSGLGIICILYVAPAASAAERPTLEQLENKHEIQKAVEEIRGTVEKIGKEREFQCMQAIGHKGFCNCLNSRLAIGLSFEAYVDAVLASSDKVNANDLSDTQKQLIENARESREECVKVYKAP
jgi:hypothetical protein